MAEFALHVLKLNIISAVVIFLVLGLSVLLKNRFTARWKYVVWLSAGSCATSIGFFPYKFQSAGD